MAQQPLTPEQHELLSASLDGELSQAERAVVEQLMQRDDAKAYLHELEQTRLLVTTHATAKAPAALLSNVMGELKPAAKVRQLPVANWWTPLYAAAAAIIVAVAIMFGPVLVSPSPAPPPEVARDALTKAKPDATWGADPAPAEMPAEKMGEALDNDETQTALTEKAANAEPTEESKQGDEKADTRRMAESELERLKDGDRGEGAGGIPPPSLPADQANPKPESSRETRKQPSPEGDSGGANDGGLGGRARGSKLGGGVVPAPGADDARRDEPAEVERDALDREDAKPAKTKEEALVRVFDLHAGEKLAAQNDAMWVAALYGKAQLMDEGDATESIRVTLDTDRVPELMKALARLSDEQGYREPTTAQAKAAEPARRLDARAVGLSGYLPAHTEAKDRANESRTELVIRIR